jgi:hypothetical protein
MPIRNRSTTDNYTDTEVTFNPLPVVSFQISNNPARVQISVVTDAAPRGQNWIDKGRVLPGYWSMNQSDFGQFGGDRCNGVRFISDVSGSPAVVDVNN